MSYFYDLQVQISTQETDDSLDARRQAEEIARRLSEDSAVWCVTLEETAGTTFKEGEVDE